MTQTAKKPIALDAKGFRAQLTSKYPELADKIDALLRQLERGEGRQDLANLIHREVSLSEEDTAFVYSWTGPSGHAFDLTLLKAFDPTPQRKPEAPHEPAPVIQDQVEAKTPAEAPAASQELAEASEPPESNPQEAAKPPPPSSAGLFTALSELIGESTLLMTLAKHDDDLTVNVMPFGDEKDSSIAAICLTGTPAELDAGFAEAISVKVQGRKSLAEQIEALKAAEKELADAKKAEADAKKAETAKKSKVAEAKKKEDEKKKQEEEKEAEKAKSQEALF